MLCNRSISHAVLTYIKILWESCLIGDAEMDTGIKQYKARGKISICRHDVNNWRVLALMHAHNHIANDSNTCDV